MLERISKWLEQAGITWKLDTDSVYQPEADDVQMALDEAARMLYSEPVGTTLEVGGLLIQKLPLGHGVYVYAGNYQ